MDIQVFKEKLFSEGEKTGFSHMEIDYVNNRKFSTQLYKGEVDSYDISVEGGVSFRGLFEGKMGYAYAEKLDENSLSFLLKEAKASATVIDSEDEEFIFSGSEKYERLHVYSSELASVTNEEKINLLKAMEKKAYTLSDLIYSINYCQLESFDREKVIANTKGLNLTDKTNGLYVFLSVVVKDGDAFKNAYDLKLAKEVKHIDPDKLAKDVVDEALSYIGATSIKSGEYPVILKNKTAASLVEAFSSIFSADEVQKGKSKLAGQLNQTIGNKHITLVDDPHFNEGFASRSFDSEGVATKKTAIIENGVLKTYLHNLKTAEKAGVTSTGHASRSSYKDPISISPSNMYIQPGGISFDDLVSSEKEALIITDMQGLHSGLNPVSGDFSVAAHGYVVRDGKIDRPVNQITVAGNFFTLLKEVEAVADDLDFALPSPFTQGHVGSPSLKIKQLSVGGE